MAILTNAGKAHAAGLLTGISSGGFTHIALGSGTTAESATQTSLTTEITTNGGARASATTSRITTTQTNDTAKWEKEFTFTGSLTISEIGLFDAASSGTMYMRSLLTTARSVEDGDTLTVTIESVQSQG